jgi:hypothetical protein
MGSAAFAYEYTLKGTVNVDNDAWNSATTAASKAGTTVDKQMESAVKNAIEQPYKQDIWARFNKASNSVKMTADIKVVEAAAICMENAVKAAKP